MKENQNVKLSNHIVTIDNRKKIVLTDIVEVISSTDKTVNAKTQNNLLNINGEGLRIEKLNLDERLLVVEGIIHEFKYVIKNKTKSFFKRLIK